MTFGTLERNASSKPMAEINMIPLIDVMLVLLVIFIITAPLLTHAVKIDLPRASSSPNPADPEHIGVAVDAEGALFWNGVRVDQYELEQRLAASALRSPQPELHLRADRTTQYQAVAEVLAAGARAGIQRIGFVSTPTDPR
jgi:biopolymer transport protein ExbD